MRWCLGCVCEGNGEDGTVGFLEFVWENKEDKKKMGVRGSVCFMNVGGITRNFCLFSKEN